MKGIFWLGILGITSVQILSTNLSLAESSNIITDDFLGNEASQVEKNSQRKGLPVEIIRGGARRGINLFHSFREFNVSEGRGAYFFSPNTEIQNILTRVTGNNRSEILGTLGTFGNSQANLFLINPNGILFGENASLDVEGSFVGTTANGVQFGERGVFSATKPEAPALLTVNPSALFFNQINAQASIQINSAGTYPISLAGTYPRAFGLRVPNGKSLLLLGGNVSMDRGRLNANGGKVELGGLTEPGIVALDINGDIFRLEFPENVKRGDVSLKNGARIDVASDGGGDIVVNVQNLEMTGESSLNAGIEFGLGSDNSKAGNIDVNATGIVNLNNSYILNNIRSNESIYLLPWASPELLPWASPELLPQVSPFVDTEPSPQFVGESFSEKAGDINISTNRSLVQNGAQVSTSIYSEGKGGYLTVNPQDVQLINEKAGDIDISTNRLLVQNGAHVSTSIYSEGKGGDLTVNAQDVQLIGNNSGSTGLFASAESQSTGDAGSLTLSTNKLLIQNGAQVSTGTFGKGKGGNLIVNAQDVELIGINKDGFPSGLLTSAQAGPTGDAGNLILSTNKLLIQNGAQVSTGTFGKGKGGNLIVNAQDVELIGITEDGFPSGLLTSAQPDSTGDAGNLTLFANKLLIQDGAAVGTSTLGKGKGGYLTINAGTLQLKNDALITARSTDSGISGNIEINVKDNFNAEKGQVITQSEQSSGGNIKITTGKNIILRNDSNIRTALKSTEGRGGNINLKANAIVVLEDSDILTFAPFGSGGNIAFNTRAFFSNPLYRPTSQTADKRTLDALDTNNRVDVNASGSISTGNIIGIPDISFLQDNLTDLPANQIDTNTLIANSCIARSSKRQENSFTITGSGGLRNSPVDGFVSRFSTGDVRNVEQISRNWKKGDPIVEPTGVYQLADGRLMLGRVCQ